MKKITYFFLFLALFGSQAQAFESPFSISYDDQPFRVAPSSRFTQSIVIRVPENHFLYTKDTELTFTALDGIKVISIDYPAGVERVDAETGKKAEVYPTGETTLLVTFESPKVDSASLRDVNAILGIQGCEEKLCLRPEQRLISWRFNIDPTGAVIAEPAVPQITLEKEGFSDYLKSKDFAKVIGKGRLFAFLIAFIAGVLTSFTPCVWPLIPITLLMIGIHKRGSILHNLLLSISLVLGLAVTYGLLGSLAVSMGLRISFLFQSPVFVFFIAAFFAFMGLSLLGLFNLQLPLFLQNFFVKVGGKGYRGAFLSGISIGFLATPCAGPLLAPMLVWVATKQEYLFGASVLCAYAIGIGTSYIIIGTFYGTFAGKLKHVKTGMFVKKALGGFLLVVSAYYFISAIPLGTVDDGLPWLYSENEAMVESVAKIEPMMIVFGAKWCPPCQKLKREVLSDQKVKAALKDVVLLYVDATVSNEESEAVMNKYGIVGWPTVLFLTPDGKRLDDLSIIGFVPSVDEMLKVIEELKRR